VAGTSLTALLERYQKLLEITQDLASTLELDTLLKKIVNAAANLCGAEAASILLYDQVKRQLYFQVTSNLEAPVMRGLNVPIDSSVAGWVLTHKQSVIIPDVSKDPRHFREIAKATNISTKSLLGIPLVTQEKVIGVLELINKQTGEFSNEDLEIICALGAQAAIAIENTRLFQQSDLISELVHELGTPLASLNTASYLLSRPEIPQEQRDEMVLTLQQEISRLTDMTASYLDFARLESGRTRFLTEQIYLSELLPEAVQVMHGNIEEKQQTLVLEPIKQDEPITGDYNKLLQVVINLLSNATKYTQEGGQIRLSANVSLDEAVIRVADNGPGIPENQFLHVYERFYRIPKTQNRAQGSGLGLSICKRIVEAHRGYIEIQSTVGEGTAFIIHLPIFPAAIR
jgi:signal transduction histidine kinase